MDIKQIFFTSGLACYDVSRVSIFSRKFKFFNSQQTHSEPASPSRAFISSTSAIALRLMFAPASDAHIGAGKPELKSQW
jgi:hypothetical protein